jgi:hypothetical protein
MGSGAARAAHPVMAGGVARDPVLAEEADVAR